MRILPSFEFLKRPLHLLSATATSPAQAQRPERYIPDVHLSCPCHVLVCHYSRYHHACTLRTLLHTNGQSVSFNMSCILPIYSAALHKQVPETKPIPTATCCDMRSIGDPESRPAVRSFDGEYGPGPSAGPSPSVGSSQQPAASSQQSSARLRLLHSQPTTALPCLRIYCIAMQPAIQRAIHRSHRIRASCRSTESAAAMQLCSCCPPAAAAAAMLLLSSSCCCRCCHAPVLPSRPSPAALLSCCPVALLLPSSSAARNIVIRRCRTAQNRVLYRAKMSMAWPSASN